MAKQHVSVRRDEIDAILELMSWRTEIGVESVDLRRDELRVHEETGEEGAEADHEQGNGTQCIAPVEKAAGNLPGGRGDVRWRRAGDGAEA